MNAYYAGIDFGTTNLKLAVFSSDGILMDCLRAATPPEAPAPEGYDPEVIFSAVRSLLQLAAERYHLRGIAITGMAEAGILLCRDTGRPLTGILPWSDRCGATLAECWSWQENAGFLTTGLKNSYKYGVYKFLWALNNTGVPPENTCWLSACDYLAYRLTGELFTDPTFAARTYLYNLRDGCWDCRRIHMFGLENAQLPGIVPSGIPGGYLLPGILKNNPEIPVAICGHDHLCAAFCFRHGGTSGVFNSMGTAEIFLGLEPMGPISQQEAASNLTYGVFVEPEKRFWMANIPAAGRSIDWAIATFLPGESYEAFNSALEQMGEIGDTPLFFPFLNGRGTPDYDCAKKAAFTGLSMHTRAQDMVNSVVNGLCLWERYLLELSGTAPEVPILTSGAATTSAPWMQRKADILQRDVICHAQSEGTLMGAVALLCEKNGFPFHIQLGSSVRYVPGTQSKQQWTATYKRYCDCLTMNTIF